MTRSYSNIPPHIQNLLASVEHRYGTSSTERLRQAYSQPPSHVNLFPGLRTLPWYDEDAIAATRPLEEHSAVIRHELHAALDAHQGFQPYRQDRGVFVPEGKWKSMYFVFGDSIIEVNRALCPCTAKVLDGIDVHSLAMFSVLLP